MTDDEGDTSLEHMRREWQTKVPYRTRCLIWELWQQAKAQYEAEHPQPPPPTRVVPDVFVTFIDMLDMSGLDENR
jgi:hypothetical protein